MIRLLTGDCRDVLATLPANSVQCVVTSPPYYGLRDYGTAQWEGGDAACGHERPKAEPQAHVGSDGRLGTNNTNWDHRNEPAQYRDTCGKCGARRIDQQLGLEATPEAYLANMVAVFREVRRVLRDDGTCWVNMGDSYATSPAGNLQPSDAKRGPGSYRRANNAVDTTRIGAKPKDLLMMPARLALALQADGWWLRSDIIWAKPNPMPESVTDRPTSAHEHVFLLTKAPRYFYDQDAIRWPSTGRTDKTNFRRWPEAHDNPDGYEKDATVGRNERNVWTIATAPFPAAHFATFPPELAERCIRAGSRPGDTILDPFSGAGTALLVADRLGRDVIGIDLSHQYVSMARDRLQADCPLFADISCEETERRRGKAPVPEPPEDGRMADLFAEAAE